MTRARHIQNGSGCKGLPPGTGSQDRPGTGRIGSAMGVFAPDCGDACPPRDSHGKALIRTVR